MDSLMLNSTALVVDHCFFKFFANIRSVFFFTCRDPSARDKTVRLEYIEGYRLKFNLFAPNKGLVENILCFPSLWTLTKYGNKGITLLSLLKSFLYLIRRYKRHLFTHFKLIFGFPGALTILRRVFRPFAAHNLWLQWWFEVVINLLRYYKLPRIMR